MSAHTPGTWTFSHGDDYCHIMAGPDRLVAEDTSFKYVSDEVKANWRVMAEAPAMLEMLERACELADDPDAYLDNRERQRAVLSSDIRALLERLNP